MNESSVPDATRAFGLDPADVRSPALYWTTAAIVFITFAAASFHAIGNVWEWGHNGFNSSNFWNAARNTLRFGEVGQAVFHTRLTPPQPHDLYTHHPMLMHAHLVLTQWLFGEAEWAGRIVPAIYSVLDLTLLFWVVRRHWGPRVALASAAVYATLPLNLIFANMIDHEQGSLAMLLLLLEAYVRFLAAPSRRGLVWCCVWVTLAMQWDWPGYYIAFFMAVMALVRGVRTWRAERRWSLELTFVAVFSAVVLVNFIGFFAWIAHARGGLHDMVASFHHRTGVVHGYVERLWSRSQDLYGPLVLGAFAAWVVWTLRRPRQLRDLIPWFFVLAQIIHSAAFKQAGHLHCYWTWHINPALAIGAAEVMVAWYAYVLRRPQLFVPAMTLVVVAIGWQVLFAFQQMRWGFDDGSASYAYGPTDTSQWEENTWARDLRRVFTREGTIYRVSSSIQRRRIEFDSYLDAELHAGEPWLAARRPPDGRHLVALFDLHHVARTHERQARLAELVAAHPTWVWDRRFVAIDLTASGASFTSFVREWQPTPWWWRWLVHPTRDRFRWIDDPTPETARGLFVGRTLHETEAVGGPGGGAFAWRCPAGDRVAKLEAASEAGVIRGLRVLCAPSGVPGPWLGAQPEIPDVILDCAGGALTGLEGRHGTLLDRVCVTCGAAEAPRCAGGEGGAPFTLRCPEGSSWVGVSGRDGVRVDALALQCATVH